MPIEIYGCRPGGLAYVVAFANRGAKDVTQRYTGSVLAADKLRDNAWWERTLQPLRKHEVSFLYPQSLQKQQEKSVPFGNACCMLLCHASLLQSMRAHPQALKNKLCCSPGHGYLWKL